MFREKSHRLYRRLTLDPLPTGPGSTTSGLEQVAETLESQFPSLSGEEKRQP